MKTKLLLFSALFGFLIILSSCQKEETTDWYVYEQTKCSDSWDTVPLAAPTLEAAVNYYLTEELEITVNEIDVQVDANEGEDCEACSCKTGTLVRVKADMEFSEVLTAEGFVLE